MEDEIKKPGKDAAVMKAGMDALTTERNAMRPADTAHHPATVSTPDTHAAATKQALLAR